MTIRYNSIWVASDGKKFRVLSETVLEGNTWIHYAAMATGLEYSCYKESFINRFRETPN